MAKNDQRRKFRDAVFDRDLSRCVVCGDQGQDAHHIMERRLFPDGGYEASNGVTLCGPCHLRAEQTTISPAELRKAASIGRVVLPPHLYPDDVHDKWGNIVLPDGRRLPGELFDDDSVRSVLAHGGVLNRFSWCVKHPRTLHLPWSESKTNDDRTMDTVEQFVGLEVVVTEKMDGENTTMMGDRIYGRSIDWRGHPARSWVANLHGKIAHDIPWRWRICGENLYAAHTLTYESLPSYFMAFAVWDGVLCLSWDDTLTWTDLLGLDPVPVLWRGVFDEKQIKALDVVGEGYVVRPASAFRLAKFPKLVGKFVRAGFAEQRPHWQLGQRVVPNGLESKE